MGTNYLKRKVIQFEYGYYLVPWHMHEKIGKIVEILSILEPVTTEYVSGGVGPDFPKHNRTVQVDSRPIPEITVFEAIEMIEYPDTKEGGKEKVTELPIPPLNEEDF